MHRRLKQIVKRNRSDLTIESCWYLAIFQPSKNCHFIWPSLNTNENKSGFGPYELCTVLLIEVFKTEKEEMQQENYVPNWRGF